MQVPDIDVRLVATSEDVATFVAWLNDQLDHRVPLSIDTETHGLDWWQPDFCRLWQVGTTDAGWAIPVRWWGKVIEHAMSEIVRHHVPVIMHNAKFDLHVIEREGWAIPSWDCVHDTAVLLHLRRSDLPRSLKGKHTAELLGPWVYQGKALLTQVAKDKYGLASRDQWSHIPVDEPAYWGYGVFDTCLTARLFEVLQPTIAEFPAAYERERQYMRIMYQVEKRGLRIDHNYTTVLDVTLERSIKRDEVYLNAHGLENPNSANQLIALLTEDYDWQPVTFTETGQPATGKEVINGLAAAGQVPEEFAAALVRFHRNTKWRSTYVERFLTGADVHGRVHPAINTLEARTGRSLIQRPALQTLPSGDPMIRRCILPDKGCDWWSLDYSNQEPRLLAHYGRSPQLLRYFTEGDGAGSIHDFVAEQMFGPTYTKEQRSLAKVFGLSRSYGAGAAKMSMASGLPLADVERLLPMYDELVGLAQLNEQVMAVATERTPPFIVTAGGRRSYADEDKAYALVNYLMQGGGADMMKDAMIRVDAAGLSEYIALTVHDEGGFSLPRGEGPALAEEIRQLMQTDEFAVPMPVSITGPGKSWGHLYMTDDQRKDGYVPTP